MRTTKQSQSIIKAHVPSAKEAARSSLRRVLNALESEDTTGAELLAAIEAARPDLGYLATFLHLSGLAHSAPGGEA